jgi:hypothetical protein
MSKSIQPIPPGQENLIPHLICSPCAEDLTPAEMEAAMKDAFAQNS